MMIIIEMILIIMIITIMTMCVIMILIVFEMIVIIIIKIFIIMMIVIEMMIMIQTMITIMMMTIIIVIIVVMMIIAVIRYNDNIGNLSRQFFPPFVSVHNTRSYRTIIVNNNCAQFCKIQWQLVIRAASVLLFKGIAVTARQEEECKEVLAPRS